MTIQTITQLRASGMIYAPSPVVRERYSIKTKAAFSHWLSDESLGFPRPVVIRGRFYFLLSEIEAWEAKKVRKLASATDKQAQSKNGKKGGRPRTPRPSSEVEQAA